MWVKQWRGRCCPATATFLHQIIIGMFFISIILIVNMIIIVSCLFLYAWMAALIEKKLRCSRKKSGRLRDVFPKKTGKCWNFSQVEDWVWHAKNHLVKLQKKWDLGRPPPLFFSKFPHFPVVFLEDVSYKFPSNRAVSNVHLRLKQVWSMGRLPPILESVMATCSTQHQPNLKRFDA